MDEKLIKVARNRNYPFKVNYYMSNGNIKTFEWAGSKGNKVDIKPIPEEVVQHLIMNTIAFTDGELYIIEDTETAKEIVTNIDEQYKLNAHTKEEIIKLLEGNINKMKSELGKVTVKEEKMFVIDVAKEIKLDSASKRDWLAEWIGIKTEMLFMAD